MKTVLQQEFQLHATSVGAVWHLWTSPKTGRSRPAVAEGTTFTDDSCEDRWGIFLGAYRNVRLLRSFDEELSVPDGTFVTTRKVAFLGFDLSKVIVSYVCRLDPEDEDSKYLFDGSDYSKVLISRIRCEIRRLQQDAVLYDRTHRISHQVTYTFSQRSEDLDAFLVEQCPGKVHFNRDGNGVMVRVCTVENRDAATVVKIWLKFVGTHPRGASLRGPDFWKSVETIDAFLRAQNSPFVP